MNKLSQLWWTQVHGPSTFLDNFCQELSKGGCFFLHHSRVLPWQQQFLDEIHRRVHSLQGCFVIENAVDVPEDIPEGMGQWFVDHFLPHQADNFLSTTSLPDFLADFKGLTHRMIWLRIHSDSQLKQWLSLWSQFAAKPVARDTIVILEGGGQSLTRRKVALFDADEAFAAFDVVQLCTIAANDARCGRIYKPYLTHLLNQLCGQEPHLVESLVEKGEELVRAPTAEAACLGLDPTELDRRIRRAQLLLLLPAVEDIRIHILGQLYQQCLPLLPIRDDYGNELTAVYEMELRHIVHYYRRGQLSVSSDQWNQVKCAYDIRNELMHNMLPLPFDDIERLLSLSDSIANC